MATDQRAYKVYLPRELADKFEAIAVKEDRPLARVFREAVEQLVESRAKAKEALPS